MRSGSTPRLYVILGSHACRTGILLLEHKGIDYKLVELPTLLHPVGVRLAGFGGHGPRRDLGGGDRSSAVARGDKLGTVPALRMNGEHVQTNREIARYLDHVQPDPPLFPADSASRQEAEEAERWGDEVFQMLARRLAVAGVIHGPDLMHNRGSDGRLGPILWHNERVRRIGVRIVCRIFAATPEAESRMLEELPEHLDRIDRWIDAGVLNGERLNAADLMIAPSLALLGYRRDLRSSLAERPSAGLVDRLLPEPSPVA